MVIEVLLQSLDGVVDTKLREAVAVEALETVDVEDLNESSYSRRRFVWRRRRVE